MEFHESVHSFIIDVGFYKISQLYGIYFDHVLIVVLVER
jgi:hypothetical protein